MVTVVEVDASRKRIALSMKEQADQKEAAQRPYSNNSNKKRTPEKVSSNPFQDKLMELKKKFKD